MSSSTLHPYSLPPIRRVVTGHTPDGKASIVRDDRLVSVPASPVPDEADSVHTTRIWRTNQSPVVHSEETVPFHRTSTIDYIILISGEVTAILEDGTERTLSEPGSILVQRGTLHTWENRGSGWVRFLAILVDAKPVETIDKEGKTKALEEGFF
ncbi:hypothetical protein BS47DRAFT_1379092 [Hydnum rufescens UP504]|uniref:Cupin type-2 domain-containing protein n=1 Tax=Hydnum rufescens UP504 TaxID=1448309 RepID=A0A9P6E288_9AGAM|nr:hypothetical protein BS47DRAFT_1379092 [Hydnum rufescens UP504]